MSITTALAIYAAFVATGSLLWQVFTWRKSHAFDVRVDLRPELLGVGSNKYEVTVVATNHGSTNEAVQEVWLKYSEHDRVADSIGPPSVCVTRIDNPELPPHRNVRVTVDLLDMKYVGFPTEVTADVILESGRRVASAPHRPSAHARAVALASSGD